MTSPDDNGVPTRKITGPKVLEKTFRILDLFTAQIPAWSVTEVAEELQMPTATTHRIMQALQNRSYLDRNGTRYQLGFAAVELGIRAKSSVDLRSRLNGVLRELAEASGETALLTVYDEATRGSLCVARIETRQSLRLSIEIGRSTPVHAGASGKALLAFLDDETVEEVLSHPLVRLEMGTTTDPDSLRRELVEIRSDGFASSREENNIGAWGLAAPIMFGENVIASIGTAAPTARHSEPGVLSLSKLVLQAARDAEATLDPGPALAADAQPVGIQPE